MPDITVVTPVHDRDAGELLFFTASRAHHAEIGGIAPGSMPPFSKNLAEEGVLIRNFKLVAAGESRFDELANAACCPARIRRATSTTTWPTSPLRSPPIGRARTISLALVERYSRPVVAAYMEHIQDAAEQKGAAGARAASRRHARIHRSSWRRPTARASPICVRFTIHDPASEPAATIDFTGTGPVVAGNLNANRAIVTAAVMYVLRLLIDEDIPLNHGVLRPVEIVLPECLLNPAARRQRRKRRRRSPAATSKRRSASSTCCSARSASPPPARGR